MPEFAHPLLLLLLFLVPLVIVCWLRLRRGALRYPSTQVFIKLPPGRSRSARWVGAGSRGLGLVAIVLALAGPRWPILRTRIPTEGIAVAMAVDVSGSMAENDFDWNGRRVTRLDAVKEVFRLFVEGGLGPGGETFDGRKNDLLALVTFATRPETACPLTLSRSVVLKLLEAEQPRKLPTESQTNIGDAVAWALLRLDSAGARRKVIVLLTDGEHNVSGPALKPRQAAQLAARMQVPIYAINAGGESGEPEADPEGVNKSAADRATAEQVLQTVARLSGGKYFRAQDTKALLAVCQEIDRLERREIQSFQYRRYHEGYHWFALAGFAFLVGIAVLEMTVWQRVP